jgi:hypothetical protein
LINVKTNEGNKDVDAKRRKKKYITPKW